ncbi:hypothetical protein OH76DRAFT_1410824 [Lentinus brumalis]|uniref:ZZ-type domain-containing protein n=1 Tax=Lentinus brumalis TaxID=2498619 RepID=A0A371CR35_9APHY|nr:hypothetical protein OH76DRAFT_1410824 [Polyporus brumalis]
MSDNPTGGSTFGSTTQGPSTGTNVFGSTTTRPTQWPTPSSTSPWGSSSPQQPQQQVSVHTGVSCDYCGKLNIKGIRYKCIQCASCDRCESCMAAPRAWTALSHDRTHQFFPIHHPGDLSDYNIVKSTPLPQTRVVHHGVGCDGCGTKDIQGTRHRCLACDDFDFCERCIADYAKREAHHVAHPFFPIASMFGHGKYDIMRNAYRATVSHPTTTLFGPFGPSHEGTRCDTCTQSPLVGVRYKCLDCADFDMCAKCFSKPTQRTAHNLKHAFFPITAPGDFSHFHHALASRLGQ